MAAIRFLAATLAAVTLIDHTQAWTVDLPSCTSPFQPFVYSGCYSDSGSVPALGFKSSLPRDGMTVEKCVADCKGNSYRYAGLEYYGNCYCGQTVSGNLLDDSSCSYPCDGNKTEICGGSNIISIYQDPTFPTTTAPGITDFANIGCWTDDSSQGRALSFPQDAINGATLTVETCLSTCKAGGFPLAGVEYGQQCWCGVVIGNGTNAAPASDCSIACQGDATENCGGPARLNLYVAKDLESLEPCGYVSSSSTPPSMTTTSVRLSTSTTVPVTTTSTTSVVASTTAPVSSSTSTSASTSIYTSTPTSTSTSTSTSISTSTTSTTCTTSTTSSKVTSTTAPITTSTTTPPTTATKPTTTSTSSLCTATVTIPSTCEYGCGNWCSSPLPDWNDNNSCYNSHSNCKVQVAACFKNAGWPGSMKCFDFSDWCSNVNSYCGTKQSYPTWGKADCIGRSPPKGGKPPTTTTSVYPCVPTTTTKPASTSTKKTTTTTSTPTKCPIPTPTSICKQASNPWNGYDTNNPVGGIRMPVVTCNDLQSEWNQKPFKMYRDSDSSKCNGYGRGSVPNACSDACKAQYDDCTATYVTGCKANDSNDKNSGGGIFNWFMGLFGRKGRRTYFEYAGTPPILKRALTWTDNSKTATTKCTNQYNDCLFQNLWPNSGGKCYAYGAGW